MAKVAVVFHSGYGHTQRLAQSVAQGAGAELLSIDADNNVRMRLLIDLHADWPAGSELAGQFAEFDGYLLSLVSIPS